MKVGIHWFRRDLRIQDNRALAEISSQVDRLVLVVGAQALKEMRFFHACGPVLKLIRLLSVGGV